MEQITNQEIFRWAITTIIALLAAAVAFYALSLKIFIRIKASCSYTSSITYKDSYISSVLLINEKDRTEPIFGIYLKCGRNIYLELREFESPLLLGPWETVKITLEPVSWYGINGSKVSLNDFFEYLPFPKLILSTRKGKYTAKPIREHWNPIDESLKTLRAAAVHPIRLKSSLSSANTPVISADSDYIVLYEVAGKKYISQIFKYPKYLTVNTPAFKLTSNSLKDKQSLESHLLSTPIQNRFGEPINVLSVHDVEDDEQIKRLKSAYPEERELPNWGIFRYHITERIKAYLYKLSLREKNFKSLNFSSFREYIALQSLPYALILTLLIIFLIRLLGA